MEAKLRAVVIGCGVGGEGRAGVHSIGYLHGGTYLRSDRVELVAAADINETNAKNYAAYHGFERTYTDYRDMLATEQPDLVSVCVWPPLHPEMTIAAAEAGAKGIWCEKPMALSMGEVDRMMTAAEASGSKLVVHHQRRYLPRFYEARNLIAAGAIGEVLTIHAGIPDWDLLSWGTHWIDMYRFLLGERDCAWVVAQVDAHSQIRKYGHLVEDHSFTCFGFEGGPHGILECGRTVPGAPDIRVSGADGIIDILESTTTKAGNRLRYMSSETTGWVEPDLTAASQAMANASDGVLRDLIAWIDGGPEPPISARGGRKTTEMIMAAYESARQGRVIDLPLTATDFPLEDIARRQAEATS